MSKSVLRVGAAVAIVGLTVFSGGLGAVALLGVKVGIGALIATGIGIASAIFLKPKAPRVSSSAVDRLNATLDPNAPRKMVFGYTAAATDIRYQATTGTDQEYLHWILCVASHELESLPEIWFDTELGWSLSGGVASKYSGYLTVAVRNPGASGNGIAIDSTWTSTATLTGCAYIHLRFKLTGNTKKAESPFAQAIPTRLTVRTKGAKLPDLREASVDPDDQTTWDWFDDDSGRNPALQLLFYLLGWRINGVLAVGRGIPPDRIDLDSFITAANMCDEPVALDAGGTEPRYRSDGVFSEADDPSLVIGSLCASMNAVLRDTGGKIALHVIHNDLASPVATFSETDILGDDEWMQTPPPDETFNIVRGRYTNPSDEALYQLVDYPEVEIASIDDIERPDSFDLPMVQSASQAQRLAKQRLQRSLYPGLFSANFNERGWQVNMGDPVVLNHIAMGWSDKLFRVVSHTVALNGVVAMTLREEHEDIYAWDADESPAVQPAVPTAYDPLLSPLVQAIGDIAEDLAEALEIGADGKLTPVEKQRAITLRNEQAAEKAGLEAEADRYGITTEKTNYTAAYTALGTYLSGLSPAWNSTTTTTDITRSTWRTNWETYYLRKQQLLNKIAAVAEADITNATIAALAAQADATAALGELDTIGADASLTPVEKQRAIALRDEQTGEKAGIEAEADRYAITTQKTAYTNAYTALGTYLAGLSPAWNSTTTTTTIARATWKSNWKAYYDARQALLNKIAEVAKTTIDAQAIEIASAAAALSAIADDGIISHDEKAAFAKQDRVLKGAYAALLTRVSELAISTTITNLLPWSQIDATNWSVAGGTLTTDGTTIAPDGSTVSFWRLDNRAIFRSFTYTVGAAYTNSVWIRCKAGAGRLLFRKPGTAASAAGDAVEVTTEWKRISSAAVAALASGTFLFEGRDAQLTPLGLLALPAPFSIAVWRGQIETGLGASPPVRTAGATAAHDYLATTKADYDKAVANITPPLPNTNDAELFPIDNALTGGADLSTGWTNSGTGSGPTALANGFVRITDSATGAFFFRHQNVTAPAGEMPIAVKVLKDGVGKATRYASISVDAVNEMRFDTSTGESFRSGGTQGGVIDGGDHWLVWIQGTVAAASISVRVYPARGAGALTSISAAATGSIDVKDAQAFFGALTDERRKLNFQNKVDLFGIALARAQKAISGEDSRRADKLNAAPSQHIIYDWTGTTSSALPKMLTCTITSGNLDVTAGYTFAFVGNGCTVDQTGAANGQTRLTGVSATNAFIAITATRTGGSAPLIGTIPVTRSLADNPGDTGGGSGATSFGPVDVSASISDTSYDGSPQPLYAVDAQMRTNGSGQMRLVLSSSYQAFSGNVTITAKAQRATASGGPWTDISGASVAGSNSSAGFWNDLNGNGIMEVGEWEDGFEGAANFNALVTVGTAATDYFIRWIAFKTGTPSGVTVSGSASGAQS